MKVKQASSKPAYGSAKGGLIAVCSGLQSGMSYYPLCGTIACGVWPQLASTGRQVRGMATMVGTSHDALHPYPYTAAVAASDETYTPYCNAGRGYSSTVTISGGDD